MEIFVENIKVSNAILSCISVCFCARTWSALVCLVLASVVCVNGGNMSTIHHFISQFLFPYCTNIWMYQNWSSYMKTLYSHVGCCIWSGIELGKFLIWNYSLIHGSGNSSCSTMYGFSQHTISYKPWCSNVNMHGFEVGGMYKFDGHLWLARFSYFCREAARQGSVVGLLLVVTIFHCGRLRALHSRRWE
jgi:hypothetical protein